MQPYKAMFWDKIHVLSMAIAIWIPCFIQWFFDAASIYHIVTVLLFGTAYLMLTRMVMCLVILYMAFKSKRETNT